MRRLNLRDESGAAVILVALSITVIFGAAVIVVDTGSVWVSRRTLITATDASALEAARTYAAGFDGCADPDVESALLDNAAGASIDCTANTGADGGGYVTVEATSAPIGLTFGRAMGLGEPTVKSRSSAMWGPLAEIRGLRPIAVCLEDPHIQDWLGLGPDTGEHPSAGVHRVYNTKIEADDCGGAPENWAFVDYSGNSAPTGEVRRWLENGYPDVVGVGDCNADGVPGDGCESVSGNPRGGAFKRELNGLVDSGELFTILVFDTAVDVGGDFEFQVYSYIGTVLHDFETTGGDEVRWLDLEFSYVVADGPCCVRGPVDTGVRAISLCGVDHDAVGDEVRCAR